MLYATGNDPNSTGVKRSLRLKESDNSLTTLLDEIFFSKFGDSGRSGWALKITEPVYIEAGTQTINMMALDFGADATGKVSLNVVWVGFLSVEPSDVVLGEDEIIDLVNEQLGIEPVLP